MAVHPELDRARILRSGSVIIFFFLPRRGTAHGLSFFSAPQPDRVRADTTNPNPIIKPISTRLLQ